MPIRIEDQTTDRNEETYLVLGDAEEAHVLWAFSRSFIAREVADRILVFVNRLGVEREGAIYLLPRRGAGVVVELNPPIRGFLDARGATLPLYRSPGE